MNSQTKHDHLYQFDDFLFLNNKNWYGLELMSDAEAHASEKTYLFQPIVHSNLTSIPGGNLNPKHLVVQTDRYCFVPGHMFDGPNAEALAKADFELLENEVVCFDEIKGLNCTMIYPVHSSIIEACQNKNILVSHAKIHSIPLFREQHNMESDIVWLNVEEDWIDVSVWRKGQLLNGNSYRFNENENVLYFILLNYFNYKLEPRSTDLAISGKINRESALFHLLSRYILNISMLNGRLPDKMVLSSEERTRYYEPLASLSDRVLP